MKSLKAQDVYKRQKEKRQAEIDILAEQDKNTALFGECKWTNEKVDLGVLETLSLIHI